MKQHERNFWKQIKDNLPGIVDRVENLATPGFPDVSGTYSGQDYWIELKVCQTKKLKTVEEMLETSQKVWHYEREKEGAIIFVLVKHEKNIYTYVRRKKEYLEIFDTNKRNVPLSDIQYSIANYVLNKGN